jgi:hypothetical protein
MSGYALKLNLQDARMRPFTVLAEFDVAHDRAEGRIPREGRERGVIKAAGCFDPARAW